MSARSIFAVLALAATPAALVAQHGGGSPPATAPKEASQFDFLLGDWDLVVKVPVPGLAAKIHGTPKLVGTWKARKALEGWGVADDLKVTDQAGNPRAYTHSVRLYDGANKGWQLVSLDVYRGRVSMATGEWKDGEIHSSSKGTDLEGKPILSRTRIYEITANAFKFQQDRSLDDGKTWTEGTLAIEARRVAPPK